MADQSDKTESAAETKSIKSNALNVADYGGVEQTVNTERTNKNFHKELLKTIVAFLCLGISAFLNFFLLTFIHDIVPRTERLPDLVFTIIQQQQRWAWSASDVLVTASSITGYAAALLHKRRLLVLRRVFLIGAISYLLRAIVMGVTFLPPAFDNSSEICLPQSNFSHYYPWIIGLRFFKYMGTLGLTSNEGTILCGDLMFSGHTIVLAGMYFTVQKYSPRRLHAVVTIIMAIVCFTGMISLVISGLHYTMDVLVGYWLVSHLFWAYHQVFEQPRSEWSSCPLSNLWWTMPCSWFESTANSGQFSNEWNWPFAWPNVAVRTMNYINDNLQ